MSREQSRNKVARYDGKTGAFIDNFVAPGSGGISGPVGIDFGEDKNLYVGNVFDGEILRYDGKTGAFIVPTSSGGLDGPTSIVFVKDIPESNNAIAISAFVFLYGLSRFWNKKSK